MKMETTNALRFKDYIKRNNPSSLSVEWVMWMLTVIDNMELKRQVITPDWLHGQRHGPYAGVVGEPPMEPREASGPQIASREVR